MTPKKNHESRITNLGKHEQFEISQKVILYNPQDKKFLITKDERPSEASEKYGVWEVPGGRMNEGEKTEQAIAREIKEELGEDVQYEIINANLGHTIHYFTEQPSRAVLFVLAKYKGGEIALSEENSEFYWNTIEEVESSKEYFPWLKGVIRNAANYLRNEELLNDLKRCQADFENYKKRQAETQKMLGGYLIEKLVLDIVPVLDNFRSATLHVPPEEKDSPWVIGIQYIEKQLETVLTDNGIQTIEVKEGEEFDPKIHEAVSNAEPTTNNQQPTTEEDASEAGSQSSVVSRQSIVKVIQKGYKFGNRVIRPAKVTVK